MSKKSPYEKAYEIMANEHDENEGDIEADSLVEAVVLELDELPEMGWLRAEAEYLAQ